MMTSSAFTADQQDALRMLQRQLERLGVEIDQFGKNSIVINSFPNNSENMDGKKFIEDCLENIKNSNDEFKKPYDRGLLQRECIVHSNSLIQLDQTQE